MESIKMKKTLLASALFALVASSNASASVKSYTFEAGDNAPETQVCITAAQEGIASAKETAKELGVNFRNGITCNKVSITRFVNKFIAPEVESFAQVVKKNALVSVSSDATDINASNQCVNAAMGGEITNRKLTCNGTNITSFAKRIKNKYNIIVSSI
jgi:hypothetical protein